MRIIFVIFISSIIVFSCKTKKAVTEVNYKGTYLNISHDTSFYGKYLNGRFLSGIFLRLNNNGSYEAEYFCDICPKYRRSGYFAISSDSIFLQDTAVISETGSHGEKGQYSYWFDSTDFQFRIDTLFRWRIDSLTFIDYKKQNQKESEVIKLILKYPNEETKMDNLPFRKIN